MLQQFKSALDDANTCVRIDPTFVKGHVRVAKASLALGDAGEARRALQRAMEYEPLNNAVQMELSNVKALEKFANDAKNAREAKDYRKVSFISSNNNNLKSYSKYDKRHNNYDKMLEILV